GPVRAHHGVDLARRHRQVDALQDLVAVDGRPQAADLERAHCASTETVTWTRPSTTSAVNTGIGCVAGSDCGCPSSRLNVLPWRGHSISRSSHHTSPPDRDTLAWLQMSPTAYTSSPMRTTATGR